jgi:hypothetical protein
MLFALPALVCHAEIKVTDRHVLFMDQGEVEIDLSPRTYDREDSAYVEDRVYHNDDYALIYRGYRPPKIATHFTDADRIEIYSSDGTEVFTITENPHWYVGTQFLFAENWVVILNEKRGAVYGYVFIDMKEKTKKYESLHQHGENLIHAFVLSAGITADESRVWIITGRDTWGDTQAITEVDGHGEYTRSYTFAGDYSAQTLESDLDLHDVQGEPKSYTYEQRFEYDRALDSAERVGTALVSFADLVERLRRRDNKDVLSDDVPVLEGIESADWETLNLGLPNSFGIIDGTLHKQKYLIEKLEYELARERNDGSDDGEANVKKAYLEYQQATSEFRHFWENFSIAD